MTESIELAFVQESDTDNLKSVEPEYKYLINPCIGGSSVAVVQKRQFEPKNVRIDEEGRIISCVINRRTYINVYASSGSQNRKNKDKFFRQDIAAFIPKNTDELILLGDFNCVTSKKDAVVQE